ncbi:MAG: dihydroneopterin aldolase [Acidimicrobiales bacterium]
MGAYSSEPPLADPMAGLAADRIEVRGLRLYGTHGVLDSERNSSQPFEVDLDLFVDTEAPAASDDLEDTADYSAATDAAARVLSGPPRRLLEALASEIAAEVLKDARVRSVTVGLRKLRPPVQHDIGSAGVRLTRSR